MAEKRRILTWHALSRHLPQEVDALQEKYGQGPCLEAAYREWVVRVADLRHKRRWSAFAPAAAEAGAKSMLCFQLWVEADNLGALNVYGAQAHAFDAESQKTGLPVAAHAAVAFADARKISG